MNTALEISIIIASIVGMLVLILVYCHAHFTTIFKDFCKNINLDSIVDVKTKTSSTGPVKRVTSRSYFGKVGSSDRKSSVATRLNLS